MRTIHKNGKAKRPALLALLSFIIAIWPGPLLGQEWLDQVDERLYLQSPNGFFRSDLSGLIDAEVYYIDQRPPGMIFADDKFFFNPRLSLFLDTRLGEHFYSLVQARWDRGFDPGAREDGSFRLDEYLLRYTPFHEPVLNFQIGKFATVVGNWVPRHDSWNNPFINAPLPYENITIVDDHIAAPTRAAFLGRKNRPADNKRAWLPVLWGPSYATGGSIFGRVEKFDYALELKNASISSRPYAWEATQVAWEYPAASGRIGWRPATPWNVGLSASYGPYMLSESSPGFPGRSAIGDFHQLLIGQDISYEWHHWQLWAEAFASRFEIPNVGDVETLVYYLEAKYKFTANFFGALRWNQQFFDKIDDPLGNEVPWDRDAWRAEAALGYRFNRHWQTKLQYGYNHQRGGLQQGEQMVAAQLTIKF